GSNHPHTWPHIACTASTPLWSAHKTSSVTSRASSAQYGARSRPHGASGSPGSPSYRHRPWHSASTATIYSSCEQLIHEAVIVTPIVTRVDSCEPVPGLSKELFEDVPGGQGFCSHQAASLRSVELCVIALFDHSPPTTSTPSSAFTGSTPPPCSPLSHGDVRAIRKWKFLGYRESSPGNGYNRAAASDHH